MIPLILLLALGVRLVALNQSLWLDEAIGAEAVKNFSFWGIISEFSKFDNHPPLYYLILKLWTDLSGYSEISLRIPSIIIGLGTIYLTFLIAKHLAPKGKPFYILAPLLLATSGLHIYYSQEARMYSLAAFLAALAVYSFLKPRWALFSLSIAALLLTDYVPVFLLPVFWLWGILNKRGKAWWRAFVLSHSLPLVLGILWAPTFFLQSAHGKWLLSTLPAWRDIAGGANLKQAALVWVKFVLGRISFRDKIFYYSAAAISSIPFILSLLATFKKRKEMEFVWLWLVVPLVLGFVASFWFPAFIYFRFLYVLPAFYILLSWGIWVIKNQSLKIALAALIILVNLGGWFLYVRDPSQQRERWRQAVAFVEERAKEDELVLFEYPEPFTPWRWYETGKVKAFGATDAILGNFEKTRERTKSLVEKAQGVYYFEYLRDLSDPQRSLEEALGGEGFIAKEIYDYFPGVGQITYYAKD